ncbi:MAG: DNA circularization N-terminal domain-containing protein [Candidatus Brocadiia bacterium]
MPAILTFSYGSFKPDAAAHVEELGGGRALLVRRFPFVDGALVIDTGFAGRRWRVSCVIAGITLVALAARRSELRALAGVQEVLLANGEQFGNVLLDPASLVFGTVTAVRDSFMQQADMEFIQLSEAIDETA